MSQRMFSLTAATIFSLIALLHLFRLLFGWNANIGGWVVPHWLSWVALIVAGYLAYAGFRLMRSSR